MHASTLHRLQRIAVRIVLGIVCCVILLPILWMFLFSFGDPTEVEGLQGLVPADLSWRGYAQVFKSTPYFSWLRNSMFIATTQTLLQVTIGFFASYAFVRFRFPGRTVLFYFVLATMVIPAQALMIPMFVTINFFGLINTWAGVIVPFVASGYAIFLLRQMFREVPQALVDSGLVDGCSEWEILRHIYLPVSLPSIGALCIILFVGHWNEYYWPLLVLTDEASMTLPVALVRFRNEGIIEWLPTLAAASMATVPVVVLYLFTQRSFVEGFSAGGVKG